MTDTYLLVGIISLPQIKPLRHASLEPHARTFFAPDKTHPVHRCQDFMMVLKPFPRHLVDSKGCIDEARMLPPWLPMPPHPSTHQRRHLCPPAAVPTQTGVAPTDPLQDRWEATSLPRPSSASAEGRSARPILRVFVSASKKRIHKRAVLRHRTRTRLVAALRTAIFRMQDSNVDVVKMLDLRKKVLMLIANPDAYAKDMEALVQEMDKGLRRVTSPSLRKHAHQGAPSPNTLPAHRSKRIPLRS